MGGKGRGKGQKKKGGILPFTIATPTTYEDSEQDGEQESAQEQEIFRYSPPKSGFRYTDTSFPLVSSPSFNLDTFLSPNYAPVPTPVPTNNNLFHLSSDNSSHGSSNNTTILNLLLEIKQELADLKAELATKNTNDIKIIVGSAYSQPILRKFYTKTFVRDIFIGYNFEELYRSELEEIFPQNCRTAITKRSVESYVKGIAHSYRQRILSSMLEKDLAILANELAKKHLDLDNKFATYGILLLALVVKMHKDSKQADIFKLFLSKMSEYRIENGNGAIVEYLRQS